MYNKLFILAAFVACTLAFPPAPFHPYERPSLAIQYQCENRDSPNVLSLPEKSIFHVPAASNFTRSERRPSSVTVTVERLCGRFPNLVCSYSGQHLTFSGCSVNGTVDPFFVPGQEIYFASKVTLTANCGRDEDGVVCLIPDGHIREPCDNYLTAQEVAVINYEIYISTLVFGPVYEMFAVDIDFTVNGFGYSFIGRDVAFGYVQVNNPTVSDLFQIIGTRPTVTYQSSNTVNARVYQTWKSLQLPDSSPLQIWDNDQFIEFDFNQYNQIQNLTAFLDTAAFISRFPASENIDIPTLCNSIQTTCVNYPQYATVAACITFMESIIGNVPVQPPASGNSVQCRAFHEVLAKTTPSIHCMHTGTQKISPTSTPCNNFP
jgi:hypothetical protein